MSNKPTTPEPIQRYSVEAAVVQRGLARATSREASIEFDTSVEHRASLMGPAVLLASAFAACVLKNVERFARMLSFAYTTASIRVTLEREDSPPRITSVQYALHIVTAEPPRRVDLLHRNLVKHGTIYNTLAAACPVSGSITAEPPGS